MIEFEEFQKIARLSRDCVVTEKIDGTNGVVLINEGLEPFELLAGRRVAFMVGSRTRWIFPEADNYGFARWAYEHEAELLTLGPGRHFGEWWGQGVQRKYGMAEKRWSLFNVARWSEDRDREKYPIDLPSCCNVVPVLRKGTFSTAMVESALNELRTSGSKAAPGFMQPEGVVIWHEAARVLFKQTLLKDDAPKGRANGGA